MPETQLFAAQIEGASFKAPSITPFKEVGEASQAPLSNFGKIKEFHKCFGLRHETEPQMDVFDQGPSSLKRILERVKFF